MQEHEYKARDKTVQKMSRDGLREENLRSKKEKRITRREADEKKTAGHREQELDFGKARKAHTAEEPVEEGTEGKHMSSGLLHPVAAGSFSLKNHANLLYHFCTKRVKIYIELYRFL